MSGESPELPPLPEDPDPVVLRLQKQMTRLKRWFEWERWLMEPRTFAPPDEPSDDDTPSQN